MARLVLFSIAGVLLIWLALNGVIGGWWVLGLAGVCAIAVYRSFNGFSRDYHAVSNALAAKYTYNQLSPGEQKDVRSEVRNVLSSGAIPEPDPDGAMRHMSEGALFGFVALAMARMGIPPMVGEGWFPVSNPYVAIMRTEKAIAFVREQFRKKYGVDVDVSIRRPDQPIFPSDV